MPCLACDAYAHPTLDWIGLDWIGLDYQTLFSKQFSSTIMERNESLNDK